MSVLPPGSSMEGKVWISEDFDDPIELVYSKPYANIIDPEGPLYTCDFEDLREDLYSDEHSLFTLDELIPIYDFNSKKSYLICRDEFSQIDHHYYIYPNVSQILEAIERKKKSPYYKCTIESHGEYDKFYVPPEQLTYSEGNGWYCIQCAEYSDLDLEGIEFTDLTYDKVLEKRANSLRFPN